MKKPFFPRDFDSANVLKNYEQVVLRELFS